MVSRHKLWQNPMYQHALSNPQGAVCDVHKMCISIDGLTQVMNSTIGGKTVM